MPAPLAAWACYLLIVAPNSGLVRISEQVAADRYSYLALTPLVALAAAGLARLPARSGGSILVYLLALGAVLGLVALTRGQCRTWRDSEKLWTYALRHGAGSSALVHNNLGVALAGRGRLAAAMAQYAEALRLDPRYADARNSLGVALASQGKLAAAVEQYNEALRLHPGYTAARNNLGIALTRQGQFELAAIQLTEALRLNPGYVPARNNLGVALTGQGKFADAAACFAKAIRLNPDYGEAHNNFALIRATCPEAKYRDGREAVESASRACDLTEWRNPRYMTTLAAAHAESGDFAAAAAWQQKAIERVTDERTRDEYHSRLALYRAMKPYRGASPDSGSTGAGP
jgi:tetratricopeptide (TPR) repeat protein